MTRNIDALINPPEGGLEEDPASNLNRRIALHELVLAKKVTLELIRDCPEEIHATLGKAFDEAIKELS